MDLHIPFVPERVEFVAFAQPFDAVSLSRQTGFCILKPSKQGSGPREKEGAQIKQSSNTSRTPKIDHVQEDKMRKKNHLFRGLAAVMALLMLHAPVLK